MRRAEGQGRQALSHRSIVLLLGCLACPCAPTIAHAQGQWQFGSIPSFSTGKYGAEVATEVLHTPFTARRVFGDGDVSVDFPFLCIWGDAGVTIVNGTPVRTERLTQAVDGGIRLDVSGVRGETTDTTTARVAIPAHQACGMGDVVIRSRYYVLDERGWLPTVAVRGHLKAPTASADRGLGTGRADEGVGLEVSRAVVPGSVVMVDGGYTFIGRPSGVDYRNSWWYDVGFAQDLGREVVNLAVFFEEYSMILPGLPNGRDLLVALTVRAVSGWQVQAGAQFGLSESAPDHGLTFGLSRRF